MRKKTLDELIKKANTIHNGKYSYNHYALINTHAPSYITCPIHGDFLQSFDSHINGKSGCPECAKTKRNIKNTKFRHRMLSENDQRYSFGYAYDKFKYNGYDAKSIVVCQEHGEFLTSWHRLKSGHGCPKCGNVNNRSELRLLGKLKETFGEVEYQKRFDWLGRQSVDFYISKYDIGIEYQGRQHFYKDTKFDFDDTVERDDRKRKKCNDNNFKLYYFTFEGNFIRNFDKYMIYTDYDRMVDDIMKENRKLTSTS